MVYAEVAGFGIVSDIVVIAIDRAHMDAWPTDNPRQGHEAMWLTTWGCVGRVPFGTGAAPADGFDWDVRARVGAGALTRCWRVVRRPQRR